MSGATLRRSLVFTGVRVHSYADVLMPVILPEVDIGRSAHLRNVIIERGVRSRGLVVGEDPGAGRRALSPYRNGICLITQPHDRWAWLMKPLPVLSVASEMFPLIKTGGLADVTGRCRGHWPRG